jgi:hypothetical protein
MNITLDKNRSGTWSLPENVKNLKGWQRLWVATGLTYLLLIIVTGCVLMPTRERLDRDMVFAIAEEVRKYEGLVFAGESPDKIFESARRSGYAAWIAGLRANYRIGAEGDNGFTIIKKNYLQAVDSLPLKRLSMIGLLLVAWIVPMGGLYAMGYVIEWINQGKSGTKI